METKERNKMRFCCGALAKVLYICRKKRITQFELVAAIFKCIEPYHSMDAPLANNIIACRKSAPSSVINKAREANYDDVKNRFKEKVCSLLDRNKDTLIILTLIEILKNDKNIKDNFVIDPIKMATKSDILAQKNFCFEEFLSSILLYMVDGVDNTDGKDYAVSITEEYIYSFSKKEDEISLGEFLNIEMSNSINDSADHKKDRNTEINKCFETMINYYTIGEYVSAHSRKITYIAVSSNSRNVLSCGKDKVLLWDFVDKPIEKELYHYPDNLEERYDNQVEFSVDNDFALYSDANKLVEYDLKSGIFNEYISTTGIISRILATKDVDVDCYLAMDKVGNILRWHKKNSNPEIITRNEKIFLLSPTYNPHRFFACDENNQLIIVDDFLKPILKYKIKYTGGTIAISRDRVHFAVTTLKKHNYIEEFKVVNIYTLDVQSIKINYDYQLEDIEIYFSQSGHYLLVMAKDINGYVVTFTYKREGNLYISEPFAISELNKQVIISTSVLHNNYIFYVENGIHIRVEPIFNLPSLDNVCIESQIVDGKLGKWFGEGIIPNIVALACNPDIGIELVGDISNMSEIEKIHLFSNLFISTTTGDEKNLLIGECALLEACLLYLCFASRISLEEKNMMMLCELIRKGYNSSGSARETDLAWLFSLLEKVDPANIALGIWKPYIIEFGDNNKSICNSLLKRLDSLTITYEKNEEVDTSFLINIHDDKLTIPKFTEEKIYKMAYSLACNSDTGKINCPDDFIDSDEAQVLFLQLLFNYLNTLPDEQRTFDMVSDLFDYTAEELIYATTPMATITMKDLIKGIRKYEAVYSDIGKKNEFIYKFCIEYTKKRERFKLSDFRNRTTNDNQDESLNDYRWEYIDGMDDISDYRQAHLEDMREQKRAISWLKRTSIEKYEHHMRVVEATLPCNNCDYTIIAALHDAIEDKKMSFDGIKRRFGIFMAQYVESLTRGDKPIDEYYRELYDNYYAIKIRIIKICDLLETEPTTELINEAKTFLVPYMQKHERIHLYEEYLKRIMKTFN